MVEYTGELSQALTILLKEYIKDKGQLPHLNSFILILILQSIINTYTSIRVIIDWDKLVSLSANSPALFDPLWLKALREIAKLGSTTNIITELHQKKKTLQLRE
jgi:hypothetical protein